VLREHDGNGSALGRETALGHPREEEVLLFSVVALIGKFPQECHGLLEVTAIGRRSRSDGRYPLLQRIQGL
jgi:hypothetical protein